MADPNIIGLAASSDAAVRKAATSLFTKLSATDIEGALNQLGSDLSDNLTLDIQNIYVGAISVEEPLYVGGKIRAYRPSRLFSRG